jgi:nitrate/TMAO reductase-like tetraheme cytochrome c subunit
LQGSLQDFVRNRPDFDTPVAVAELIANAADDKETLDDADQSADADLSAEDAHEALLAEERYPPAATCGNCHPKHYREWSVSQHAYSQLSPVYLSLNNRINQLTNGSNGDFCLRCHNQVGANLGENSFVSNLERHPTSREGITCVVCHRVNKAYNKASGRLALVEGTLTEPVFGPTGNEELARVLDNAQEYGVTTDPNARGQLIHKEAIQFAPISTPMFCGTCHDVTLFNGFRLEEAFSEYRLSPAAAKGVTCQDCHMGKVQGIPSGYDYGPAAVIFDVPTKPRKLTNHLFAGPDYSLIHPGIFPHNADAQEFATLEEWLQFDVAAGWGTDEFEDTVTDDTEFPEAWESIDDRYEAREIIDEQLELLEWVTEKRLEILRNGYILGDIVTDKADKDGIRFRVQVRNGTDGHNVPTGFTGERLVWLDVTVVDRDGTVIFRSGDRDPNGDLRDGHSSYVHAGEVELDPYLFSLQSIFLTQNGRGGEIEHVIPIPYPVFALPRVLPSTASLVFTGEPATERNHKKGIEPLGQRWAEYKVAGSALTGKGPYRATVKLMEQPVPVNLLVAIQGVGFDYGMTPRQLGDALIAGAQLLWERELTFDIE